MTQTRTSSAREAGASTWLDARASYLTAANSPLSGNK